MKSPKCPGRPGGAGPRSYRARGSAAAAIVHQRCPAGRLKETRPEGTGIAGFLVLLPRPSKLRFLPSTVTLRGLKFPPAFTGALRGQTSPGPEEGTAKQRDRGENICDECTACKSRGVRGGMRQGTVIFAGAAASPSLCPSLCPSLPTLSTSFPTSHMPAPSVPDHCPPRGGHRSTDTPAKPDTMEHERLWALFPLCHRPWVQTPRSPQGDPRVTRSRGVGVDPAPVRNIPRCRWGRG